MYVDLTSVLRGQVEKLFPMDICFKDKNNLEKDVIEVQNSINNTPSVPIYMTYFSLLVTPKKNDTFLSQVTT